MEKVKILFMKITTINHKDFKKCAPEFFATFMLILLSCWGNITCREITSHINSGTVTILVMHTFGCLSGGHANPNITLACSLLGFLTPTITFGYIICQFFGALVGYSALTLLIPNKYFFIHNDPVCFVKPNENINMTYIWLIEFFVTFIFILAWFGYVNPENEHISNYVTVRFVIIVIIIQILGYVVTGISTNLATLLATAIFQENYRYLQIYGSAQLLAVSCAVIHCHYFGFTKNFHEVLADYEQIKKDHKELMDMNFAEIKEQENSN